MKNNSNIDLESLIEQLKQSPATIEFDQVIDFIEKNYHYSPSHFTNGQGENIVINQAGSNEGSCKIFAFAQLQELSQQQTLACFGHYYRDDVLKHPQANDHGNIRNFMETGWTAIHFDSSPLQEKTSA